jgi:hypothetical protein
LDINQYISRVKHKSLPSDFAHQEGLKFASSWDYAKSMSNYHFDKWRKESEGEWYHCLGRYVGDWSDAVPRIIEKSKELDWADITTKGLRTGFVGGQTPMKEQEANDRAAHGLSDVEYTNVVLEDFIDQFPSIKNMVDYWCLEKVTYRVHVQWPGQTFAPHIDKLWHRCPEDPSRIIRFIVTLSDWEYGQFLMYGNSIYTQWHAGDVHIFDTNNVPHCTVNLSRVPRPNITITGLRTRETDQRLAAAGPDSRYSV